MAKDEGARAKARRDARSGEVPGDGGAPPALLPVLAGMLACVGPGGTIVPLPPQVVLTSRVLRKTDVAGYEVQADALQIDLTSVVMTVGGAKKGTITIKHSDGSTETLDLPPGTKLVESPDHSILVLFP